MKPLRPLFFFFSVLAIVSLACGGGSNIPPTQAVQPTQPPPPTAVPPTEVVATEPPAPTEPPTPESQQFFTEEFDTSLSNDWSILTVTGSDDADPDEVTVEPEDGKLVWNFESEWVYYYLFYDAFTYEDVQVEVRADNRGRNNNTVSLICRYDPDVGWYEFNIANNGLYEILYGEVNSNGNIGYKRIANGGSNAINQGKDVNEYSISCKGDELSLTINGDEVNTISERNYALRDGQVGISVSSFEVLPILIEMDWIKISEP